MIGRLLGGERGGLLEDRVGDPDLADVVEEPGDPDSRHALRIEPELAAMRTHSSATVSQWLRVYESLASTARASAVASVLRWRSSGGRSMPAVDSMSAEYTSTSRWVRFATRSARSARLIRPCLSSPRPALSDARRRTRDALRRSCATPNASTAVPPSTTIANSSPPILNARPSGDTSASARASRSSSSSPAWCPQVSFVSLNPSRSTIASENRAPASTRPSRHSWNAR